MIDISKLSSRFEVRRMRDADADAILSLCLENTLYYRYCGKQPTKELILGDLHITPPGIEESAKYYIGFFEGDTLAAVMDLIDGYPDEDMAFIGFFMMNSLLQGAGLGSKIVSGVCAHLKETGHSSVMLGIDKGNPQSAHFWNKNGFAVQREVERGEGIILVANKTL